MADGLDPFGQSIATSANGGGIVREFFQKNLNLGLGIIGKFAQIIWMFPRIGVPPNHPF